MKGFIFCSNKPCLCLITLSFTFVSSTGEDELFLKLWELSWDLLSKPLTWELQLQFPCEAGNFNDCLLGNAFFSYVGFVSCQQLKQLRNRDFQEMLLCEVWDAEMLENCSQASPSTNHTSLRLGLPGEQPRRSRQWKWQPRSRESRVPVLCEAHRAAEMGAGSGCLQLGCF